MLAGPREPWERRTRSRLKREMATLRRRSRSCQANSAGVDDSAPGSQGDKAERPQLCRARVWQLDALSVFSASTTDANDVIAGDVAGGLWGCSNGGNITFIDPARKLENCASCRNSLFSWFLRYRTAFSAWWPYCYSALCDTSRDSKVARVGTAGRNEI